MIDRVTDLFPVPASASETVPATTASSGPSFSTVLEKALNKVAELEIESAKMGQQLAAGAGPDLHTVMIAGEKASLAIQLTVQVRNKAIEAYQEIMRMQM